MKGKGWGHALVAAGALLSASSCGGAVTEDGNATDGAGGAGAGDGGAGGAAGSSGGGGIRVSGAGTGGACRSDAFTAEPLPVDLFLMFDQSSSMGDLVPGTQDTWWSAATGAVTAFADNPRAAGFGMGIQYFPLDGAAPASCAATYSTPEVPIGLLPGVAEAIRASLASHGPSGLTPSAPALQGAIDHMRSHARPGRAAAVVFVTDGFPTECEPGDVAGLAEIARAGMDGTPPVRTFVVALGQGLGDLRAIADAGGTADALLIEGGNVREQVENALLSAASTSLRCEFELPPPPIGEQLDIDLVSLGYTPGATGISEHVPRLQDRGACDAAGNDGHGWYFDDPSNPVRILVCPATCRLFAGGSVSIAYGCTAGPAPVG